MADIDDRIKSQVNFADGTFAWIRHIIPDVSVTVNGVTEVYYEFILRPTYRTTKKWDLKEKKEQGFIETGTHQGYYKKRYQKVLCQILDPSPRSQVWLLHCDWEGKKKDIFNGKLTEMQDVLGGLKKENDGLRRQLIKLGYELLKSSKDPALYWEKSAENMKKILGNMNIVVTGGPNEGGEESGKGQ